MQHRTLTVLAHSVAALTLTMTAATAAHAQADYPSQPITIIVPYAPGGTTDVLGRALAASLGKQLKQSVIVENKPGAAGSMGVVEMLKTKPDGYKLTLTPVGIFRQPYLQKTPYDPIKDVTYIASFATYDFILGVPANSPFKTLKDLVDYAKQNPGAVDYGTPGKFTGNQVAMVLLGKAVGTEFVHVPYKGDSEAIASLVAGHTKAAVTTNSIMTFMESGKVRALAVAADKRPAAFAQVPTFKEAGYDVVVPSPLGIAGPKGLPQPIVQKLDTAVKAAMEDPDVQRVIQNYGIRTDYRDHKAYAEFARTTFASEKALVQSMGLND